MNPINILFCDIDDTLTTTISGHKFKQNPTDIKLLGGVREGIEFYASKGWLITGISNQGGIEKKFKTLSNTIEEMQNTIKLLPQIQSIFFCPDFDGIRCYQVNANSNQHYNIETLKQIGIGCNYRKPSQGMVILASRLIENAQPTRVVNPVYCEFISDRMEDQECADNAKIPFIHASIWRAKYL